VRILFIGDIVGRSGRAAVFAHLPELRRRYAPDRIVANAENAAAGFGLTRAIADQFFEAGIDLLTLGNHCWDQRELVAHIENEPRILRPLNMAPGTPGRGLQVTRDERGRDLVVCQVIGRLFMGLYDDPFRALEAALGPWRLGGNAAAILVDVHAEATSEKMALAHFLDGRVSAVVGTHTHVPTADARVLGGGTACMTDVGMTGDYDSVIGMDKEGSILRWRRDVPTPRLEPAAGEATLCAALIETDDATGLARTILPIRVGGCLAPSLPELPAGEGGA
jgi:metallophosphoesterase (TIGR00282 family)